MADLAGKENEVLTTPIRSKLRMQANTPLTPRGGRASLKDLQLQAFSSDVGMSDAKGNKQNDTAQLRAQALRIQELEEKNKGLNQALDQAKAGAQRKYAQQHKEHAQQLLSLQEDMAQYAQENEQLEQRYKDLKAEGRELYRAYAAKTTQLRELESLLDARKKHINDLELQLQDEVSATDQWMAEADKNQAKIKELETHQVSLLADLQAMETSKADLLAEIEHKNSVVEAMTSDLGQMLDENDCLRSQLATHPSPAHQHFTGGLDDIRLRFQQAMQSLSTVSASPFARLFSSSPTRPSSVESTSKPESPKPDGQQQQATDADPELPDLWTSRYELLQSEYNTVCSDLASRADQVDILQNKLQQQEQEYQAKTQALEEQTRALQRCEQQLIGLREEHERWVEDRTNLAEHVTQLEATMAITREELHQSQEHSAQLDQLASMMATKNQQLEAELQEARMAHQLELEQVVNDNRTVEYEERYHQLAAENVALKEHMQQMLVCVQAVQSAEEKDEATMHTLELICQQLQQRVLAVSQREITMADRERAMSKQETEHCQQMQNMQEQVQECTAQSAKLAEQARELHQQLSTAQDQAATLQRKLTSHEQQLQEQATLATHHAQLYAQSQAQVEQQTYQLADLRAKVEQLRQELTEAEANITALDADNQQAYDHLHELTQESQKLSASYEEQIERLQQQCQMLQNSAVQAQARIDELAQLLEEEQIKFADLEEFVEAERSVRQEAIDELEVSQVETVSKLAEACHSITELKAERQALALHLEEARPRLVRLAAAEVELAQAARANHELESRLIDRELAFFSLEQTLDYKTKELASMADNQTEITNLRTYIKEYEAMASAKIQQLKENLTKAEAEVTFLDEELSKATAPK